MASIFHKEPERKVEKLKYFIGTYYFAFLAIVKKCEIKYP